MEKLKAQTKNEKIKKIKKSALKHPVDFISTSPKQIFCQCVQPSNTRDMCSNRGKIPPCPGPAMPRTAMFHTAVRYGTLWYGAQRVWDTAGLGDSGPSRKWVFPGTFFGHALCVVHSLRNTQDSGACRTLVECNAGRGIAIRGIAIRATAAWGTAGRPGNGCFLELSLATCYVFYIR